MAAPTIEQCRLVTRSDFDGLVCAALLRELGILDEIKFVHPKDMQDGLVEITDRDITTNLPYVPGARLAFDHHESETLRVQDAPANHIISPGAKSALPHSPRTTDLPSTPRASCTTTSAARSASRGSARS